MIVFISDLTIVEKASYKSRRGLNRRDPITRSLFDLDRTFCLIILNKIEQVEA